MSITEELEAKAAAATPKEPEAIPDTHRLLARGDELEFAKIVKEDLTKAHRWVFSEDEFWRYSKTKGVWEGQDIHEIRSFMMRYEGLKVYGGKKTTKKEVEVADDGGEKKKKIVEEEKDIEFSLKFNNRFIEGSRKLMESSMHDAAFFRDAPIGTCFTNCFVTVGKAHQIEDRPHSPENRARVRLSIPYKKQNCTAWLDFMTSVFKYDADADKKIQFIREFIGLCMVGRITPYEKLIILAGTGSNGKSVLIDVIESLFPEDAVTHTPPQKWSDEYYAAYLKKSAINLVSELPTRDISESEVFKAMISGNGVDARNPAGRPFKYKPRAGHAFSLNPPYPRTDDFSHGFWRRIVIISFNRTFDEVSGSSNEKKDRLTLMDSLLAERSGIAVWALEGATHAIKRGRLIDVPSSEGEKEKWLLSTDQVFSFIKRACFDVPDAARGTYMDQLYQGYVKWHKATGGKNLIGQYNFYERLRARGYAEDKETDKVKLKLISTWTTAPPATDPGPEPDHVKDPDAGGFD